MQKKPKKTLNTALRALLILFIGILIGSAIYTVNAKNLLRDALPMPLGFGTSVVLSGSMEPEFSAGDLIVVKRTDEFYERQIVVYQSGGSLTVHRIIEINGDEIITQGDANNIADDPITRDMIKGEVIFSLPFIGEFITFLKNPFVTILLVGFALFLMELSFKNDKKAERDELEALKDEIKELKDEIEK